MQNLLAALAASAAQNQSNEAGLSTKNAKSKGKEQCTSPASVKMKAKTKRQPNASGTRKTSMAWDHFSIIPGTKNTNPMAACNYCATFWQSTNCSMMKADC